MKYKQRDIECMLRSPNIYLRVYPKQENEMNKEKKWSPECLQQIKW